MKKRIVFITGGARSGKSSFALGEAEKIEGRKAYIATAQALDDEMKERIEKHRKERGVDWDTFEEPLKVSEIIADIKDKYSVIVLDCLTLWLSNIILQSKNTTPQINDLLHELKNLSRSRSSNRSKRLNGLNDLSGLNSLNFFIVSNEVGMGIVPENELARKFRDTAGFLNQKAAEIADEAYLVTAGIPIKIKGQK